MTQSTEEHLSVVCECVIYHVCSKNCVIKNDSIYNKSFQSFGDGGVFTVCVCERSSGDCSDKVGPESNSL